MMMMMVIKVCVCACTLVCEIIFFQKAADNLHLGKVAVKYTKRWTVLNLIRVSTCITNKLTKSSQVAKFVQEPLVNTLNTLQCLVCSLAQTKVSKISKLLPRQPHWKPPGISDIFSNSL